MGDVSVVMALGEEAVVEIFVGDAQVGKVLFWKREKPIVRMYLDIVGRDMPLESLIAALSRADQLIESYQMGP
jgi:hypothetical protein